MVEEERNQLPLAKFYTCIKKLEALHQQDPVQTGEDTGPHKHRDDNSLQTGEQPDSGVKEEGKESQDVV